MLNGAASDLLIAGLRFINTFLETSPSKQIQLYIQAELEQAGFSSETFKKVCKQIGDASLSRPEITHDLFQFANWIYTRLSTVQGFKD